MSSGSGGEKRVRALAMEITDEVPIDWAREQARGGADDHLRAIRLIEEVFQAHHSLETPPGPGETPLFRWGSLEIRARIAEGGFGEIYRAFDPRLQRTVAVKLRRKGAAGSSRQWIEEARKLASVKHPNVLIVHGAEIHDDRAGIETEWIDGTTLDTWLEENGPASAAEASGIGVDLCRALAAVHHAGLVHGDVKAANVMRERGGRVVLMDFGSAAAGGGVVTGTPLYTAPEVLRGDPATPRSDVFSLGTLLYRLVTGADPYPARSLDELKELHRRGEPVPLRSLRPELSGGFVRVVTDAIAVDPSRRPRDVAALEERLESEAGRRLARRVGRPTTRARFLQMVVAAAVVLLGLFLLWRTFERPDGLVTVHQSEFVRVANGTDHPLPPHAELAVGDHIAYRFAADEDLHVYVLDEDAVGNTYVLFPAPGVDVGNPLVGGQVHRLPGTREGESFDWVVTNAGGTETFLVVAAREPVALLESELARMETADPDREPAYVQLTDATVRGLRGIGGMAPTSDTGAPGGDRLAQLATELQGPHAKPGIWVQALSVGRR